MAMRLIPSRVSHWAAVVAFTLAILFIIDRLTNSIIDLPWAAWDFNHYIQMAERGLAGNPGLVAPYAYRPLTPLLAGWMMHAFSISSWRAFKLIAWAGAALNLVTLCWLLRRAGRRFSTCLFVIGIIALGQYQVKFLFFDPFRPDHLAFPLINLAYLALWADMFLPAALVISLGLLAREFLLLPIGALLAAAWQKKTKWLPAALVAAAGLSVLALTRRLIPVSGHEDYVSFSSLGELGRSLISVPLDGRRTINLLYCLLAYLLPLGMLFTKKRWRGMWTGFGDRRVWLVAHAALTLMLTLYGGTDLARFVAYLYLPLAFALGGFLEEEGVSAAEKVLMLTAVIIFNRIPWPYPNASLDAYLDFFGGYHNRLNLASALRWMEMAGWLAAGAALRIWLRRDNQSGSNKK